MQDLNDKVTGGNLTAAEWNEVPSEIQNVIEATGQTLSSGDLDQLGKGVAGYAASGAFYTDSGAADVYVLTATGGKQAPAAYADGMRVGFVAANANTGASTVNVAGLGVKNINLPGGAAPGAGSIANRASLVFDLGNDRFELASSGSTATQVFTSSDTYTPTVGVKSIKIVATGGGAGGGGVDGQGAGTSAVSSPGSGGSTAIVTTSEIDATYTIVVGTGGAGGAAGNNAGADGVATTVTSTNVTLNAPGGSGGNGNLGSAGIVYSGGPSSAIATGGDINLTGGTTGLGIREVETIYSVANGGSSYWGDGARGSQGASVDAVNFGSGGGNAANIGSATDTAGGDGAAGLVVIEEFF